MGLSKKDRAFIERALFALKHSVGDEADRQIAAIRDAIGKVIGLEVLELETAIV